MKREDFVLDEKTCRRLAKELAIMLSGLPQKLTEKKISLLVYLALKRHNNNKATDKGSENMDSKHKKCFKVMVNETIGFPRVEVLFNVGKTSVFMSYGFENKKWELLGIDHGRRMNTTGTPDNPEILCANCWKPIKVQIPNLKVKIQFQVKLITEMAEVA